MELLAPNPPVREFDTILLWPFSLQGQGALFAEREKRDSSPAAWLKKYAEHIEGGKSGWQRVENPLEEYFGVPHLYQPHQQHAEFVYLHPFIQKLLYESDSRRRAMEVLVRKDICQLKVELSRNPAHMAGQPEGAPRQKQEVVFKVARMQLYLFTTDLAVLAVELQLPAAEGLDFHLACDAANQVRRVYAPYFSLSDPKVATGDCPFTAQWLGCQNRPIGEATDFFGAPDEAIQATRADRRAPLVPHWASLLEPLIPWTELSTAEVEKHGGESQARRAREASALCYEQLGDERAYAMVRLALPDPHALPEQQHYRLAYLDSAGSGFASSPEFLRQQPLFYDRFWNLSESWMTTRYAMSGYSFTMLVSDYELNLPGGLGPLFRGHFQHHYFFLNLLAVMQRGSLLIFWDRLSNLLREYSTEGNKRPAFHDDQRWLSEDFAHYLARFEFSEVSNQIQPLELFDQLRRSMRIERLNKDVLDQLRYAREIEESNYEEKSAEQQGKLAAEQGRLAEEQTELNRIAKNWIPAALTLSLLGLSFGVDELWCWIMGKGNYVLDPWRVFIWLLILAASLRLVYGAFSAINHRASPIEPRPEGAGQNQIR